MRRTFFGFLIAISLCVTPILLPAQETGKRFITDMTGRRVVITGPVKRVVSTFKPASLCVLSLGFAHTLVGVDNSSRKDPLQQAVWPDIQHLAGVGTKSMGINLETLVSLEPDLVIFYSQNDGLSATEKLTAMGIPCIVILPESFDSILEAMALIAHAMGGIPTNLFRPGPDGSGAVAGGQPAGRPARVPGKNRILCFHPGTAQNCHREHASG